MDLDEPNKQLTSDLPEKNILNFSLGMPKVKIESVPSSYNQELTTKRAVELLLEGTLRSKVCRYCLNIASPLSDLDQIMQIAGKGALYKVTIRNMVASFHPFKALNDPNFPNKICNKCLNRTITAYLFTQQCEQSERALRNCFEDMFAKLEKLDPLERTKKRGRQKLNPNYNVLYTEHQNVMDYAEPMRQIVNIQSVSLSNEKYMSDFECPKCWQIFIKIDDLIAHEKSHPSNMWFNCRLCGKSFVKRVQLKRHWKQLHRGPEIEPEIIEKTDFQCSTCGFISKDHSSYLQHIEKHKFQSVLEHLVEKNMDKLCAVCLDKTPKLVELDKMVRLHGGYPGVTGDKTLYSILGSTLPDRKSYKYQELHVPHQAKIMKFAKLTKDKPQNETLDTSGCNVNQIIISNPLIISNDKFDCDEMFLFFFSDPSYYKDENEKYFVEKTSTGAQYVEDNSISKDEVNDNLAMLEQLEKIENKHSLQNGDETLTIHNESNKSTNNEVNEGLEKSPPINETPCKTCWVFNKPTCKTCIDKQTTIDQKAANTDINYLGTKEKCNYCWIFKTSDKCDICKKVTDIEVTTTYNITADLIDTITIEDVNVDGQRKRKLTDDETKPKRTKWDCHICLTTNVEERQTCICCESNRDNQNDSLKVNLDCKHPFKIFKTDVTRENADSQSSETVTKECNDNKIHQHILTLIPTVNFEGMHLQNVEDTYKPFVPSNNDLTEERIKDTEDMDIADEYGSQIMIPPNPNPFSFNIARLSNNTAHSSKVGAQPSNVAAQLSNIEHSSILTPGSGLMFNIGAGSSKGAGRRIARPLRRIAYHK